MAVRPTPFALVFHTLADERFPAIRDALARAGADPRDRDAFLLTPEVVQLLRDLRPDDGFGEAMDQLVAFVHHAYLWWSGGSLTLLAGGDGFARLMSPESSAITAESDPALGGYVQLPQRRVWGQPVADAPHQPLDGVSLHHAPDGALRVLGIFGLHQDRLALTIVEVAGPRPPGLVRPDGTPLFAPALPGAAAAGLHSLLGGEELLELGWRARALAGTAASSVP